MTQRIEIVVPWGVRRTRLEDFVFGEFPGLSRMYLRRVIKEEKCEVNGRLENIGYRVRGGDFIEVELDPTRENSMRPEDVPIDVLYEDEHLAVVIKPHGMLVHPTNRDKNGTLLNALAFHFNAGAITNGWPGANPTDEVAGSSQEISRNGVNQSSGPAVIRPGLVHRLDRQTSGVMVIAKTTRAHRILAKQFQRKTVEKKYLALVDGVVANDEGVIDAAIGRYADQKRWDLKEGSKSAVTRFRVLRRDADSTLLELEPVTGRTNQLRIHCASIGHPIVGDVSRGGREFERLCLHAWRLAFLHPAHHEPLVSESPISFQI